MHQSTTQQKVYNAYFAQNNNYLIDQLTHPIRPKSSVMMWLSCGRMGSIPAMCCLRSPWVAWVHMDWILPMDLLHWSPCGLIIVLHSVMWFSSGALHFHHASCKRGVLKYRRCIHGSRLAVLPPFCARYHHKLLLIEESRHIVTLCQSFNFFCATHEIILLSNIDLHYISMFWFQYCWY